MNEQSLQRPRLLTATGAIGLATFALGLLFPENTTVYYPSLYANFHWLTWLGFLVALTSGMLQMYWGAFDDRGTWLRGLLLVLGSYLLLYTAPKAAGHLMYATTADDAVYHLGIVRSILDTGFNIDKNWYPATHVLITAIHLVSEIPLSGVMLPISYLFTSLYIVTTGFYTRLLSNRTEVGMVTTFTAAPLLFSHFHRVIQPASLSFMLLPMFLYFSEIYFQTSRRKLTFIGVAVFVFLIPFFHPLTVVFACLILFIRYGYGLFEGHPRFTNSGVGNLAGLLGLIGGAWYVHQERTFHGIVSVLLSNFYRSESRTETASGQEAVGSGGILSTYTGALSEGNIELSFLLREYVFGLFASAWIYGLLGGIFATIFLYRFAKSRGDERIGVYPAVQTYIGACIVVGFLVLDLIVANPFRAARYAFFFGAIVVGFGLTQLRGKTPRRHKVASVAIVVLVIFSAATASMSLYRENHMLDQTTVEGASWYIDYENNYLVQTRGFSTKIESYIEGEGVADDDPPNFRPRDPKRQLPMHLGYDTNDSVCDSDGSRRYLLIREQDTKWFTAFPRSSWNRYTYFTDEDVEKLDRDSGANRIYANNDFRAWVTVCK